MRTTWGAPRYNPASRFLQEIPESYLDWRREGAPPAPSCTRDYQWGGGASDDVDAWRQRVPGLAAHRREATSAGGSGGGTAVAVLELAPGDRVTHDSYGLGTVIATTGTGRQASATIDFGQSGQKRLLLRYAPVEKL
jgi:DNA helicase-2/ATP-dependent DNA helicase PcrA